MATSTDYWFRQIHKDFMRKICIFMKTLEKNDFVYYVAKYQRYFHKVPCYYWQRGPIYHIIDREIHFVILLNIWHLDNTAVSCSQMCHIKVIGLYFSELFHPLRSIHVTLPSIFLCNHRSLSRHTVRAKNLNAIS